MSSTPATPATTPAADGLERLAHLKVEILSAAAWTAHLGEVEREPLLRAAIAATRALILADWEARRPDDRRPHDALAAAEAWLAAASPDAVAAAKAAAKECTAARGETFGIDHRVPEAARGIAWAVTGKDHAPIWEALVAIEEELVGRVRLAAEYHKVPEQRRALLAALRAVLAPPPAAAPATGAPVPYAASGSFVVGQRLLHAKFGALEVVATGDKWLDARLEDGTVKRLAQRPR